MRLFPAKPSKPATPPKQILQATVARRASRASSIEQEEEPTTSFTTALVVVVLLHVVAAGGVYMFESIKTHHPNAFEGTPAPVAQKTTALAQSAPAAAATQSKPAVAPAPAAADPVKKAATSAPAEVKDSGNTYIVAKGDNPVNIAKKLRVGYDDLLKLNHIDDPKKLRIGQKLHIPLKLRAAAN